MSRDHHIFYVSVRPSRSKVVARCRTECQKILIAVQVHKFPSTKPKTIESQQQHLVHYLPAKIRGRKGLVLVSKAIKALSGRSVRAPSFSSAHHVVESGAYPILYVKALFLPSSLLLSPCGRGVSLVYWPQSGKSL